MSEADQTPTAADLRMVAIFRRDLPLPAGKLAAQAGHAFVAALWLADRELAARYTLEGQTKIILTAPDLSALHRIETKAHARGVAAVMIVDAARTVLSEPTATVLGMGPMSKTDCNALTRGLELM